MFAAAGANGEEWGGAVMCGRVCTRGERRGDLRGSGEEPGGGRCAEDRPLVGGGPRRARAGGWWLPYACSNLAWYGGYTRSGRPAPRATRLAARPARPEDTPDFFDAHARPRPARPEDSPLFLTPRVHSSQTTLAQRAARNGATATVPWRGVAWRAVPMVP